MCGRYVTPASSDIQAFWAAPLLLEGAFGPHYNVAPTLQVPVIHTIPERGTVLGLARWGLVPHWWKQADLPSFTFNARSEEAATKPMWREALQHSRCIMPAAGWYEWKTVEAVDEKTGEVKQVKQPYFLFSQNQPVIGIAGLFSTWLSPDGPIATCALMTKAASPGLMEVHDRMPVILSRQQCDQWLAPSQDKAMIADMISASEADFSFHAVSRAVNNARNNSPDLLNLV